MTHYKETQFGFEYGSASVSRLFSDEKEGWVMLQISSPRKTIKIYVTKTGKIRVFGDKEWKEND